ncbi:MAG TPA: hypothetical protein DD426_02780 [Clostridiaceae bacterium]|nr:hypothetical protein [Clostridiaceae bacterium]
MDISVRIPVCNIIACENITNSNGKKMYICNPFTAAARANIKKFYTYTIIQGIPNGLVIFKIMITDPFGNIVKETEESIVLAEENIIRVKTLWMNINFDNTGEYKFAVLIKCNKGFEITGTAYLNVM